MTRTSLGLGCLVLGVIGCGSTDNARDTAAVASGGSFPSSSVAQTGSASSGSNSSGGAGNGIGGSSSVSTGSTTVAGGSSAASSSGVGGAAMGGTTTPGSGSSGSSSAAGGTASGGASQAGAPSATGAMGGNAGSTGAPTGTPVAQHGQLKVVGVQLVDASGNPVQLKGPSSMWLNWESRKFAEDKSGLNCMRDDWKATLVRASMGVDTTSETDNDYVTAPDIAKAQVNQIVQNAIDLGMYVIIDWHFDKAETRQDLAVAFFTDMATQWGSYPNVIYETYNEPLTKDWTIVKPYHEAVVAAIRAVDPDNIIVLGTPNFSQFVDLAAANPVTSSTNLMYALHFYSCSHTQKLRDTGSSALAAGLPLFVTEWGATHADGGTTTNPQLCLDEAQLWHDWMNANKISWAAWKWDRCVDQTCYFKPTVSIPTTGPWTDDMLNGHAPFVRDRMRE